MEDNKAQELQLVCKCKATLWKFESSSQCVTMRQREPACFVVRLSILQGLFYHDSIAVEGSKDIVAHMGVEPTTFALSARRSNQLS